MQKEPMAEKRAGEIALAILKHRATNRKIELDPQDRCHWSNLSRKSNITIIEAQDFFLYIVLPVTLEQSTGVSAGIPSVTEGERKEKFERIALKIMKCDPVTLDPEHGEKWLENLSGHIRKYLNPVNSIELQKELKEFFILFVLPHTISKIMEWKGCTIEPVREHHVGA